MNWAQQKDIILAFLASGMSGWFLYEMHQLRNSVQELTLKLATILQKTSTHEEQLRDHEERIRIIEWSRK